MNPTPSQPMPEPQETPLPSDPAARLSDEREAEIAEAIEIIRHEGRASVSLLQRRLRWGYIRAASVVDVLQRRGILGEGVGAKSLTILNLPATRTPAPEAVAVDSFKLHTPVTITKCGEHVFDPPIKCNAGDVLYWIPEVGALQATPPVEADKEGDAQFVLRMIVESLPVNRDWLDPVLEKAARNLIKSQSITPPNAADKDTEIARLREENAGLKIDREMRKVAEDELADISKLFPVSEESGVLEAVEKSVADLTTARATIAGRDRRIAELVGALEAVKPYIETELKSLGLSGERLHGTKIQTTWNLLEAALARAAEGKEQA